MANKNNIQELKKKTIPILSSYGVKRAGLFGSYVRGDNNRDSDIDILIEFPRGKTIFDIVELENMLSSVLGRKVDLVTVKSVSPYLIDRIRKEVVEIYR